MKSTDAFIQELTEFAEVIVKALILYPDMLTVTAERKNERVILQMSGHAKCDHGKLIGSKGKTFRAYQELFQIFAQRYGENVYVNLLEGVVIMPETDVGDDPNWTHKKSIDLAVILSKMLVFCISPLPDTVVTPRDVHDCTVLEVRSSKITPEIATSVSILIKAIGRMRGRKVQFNAEAKDTPSTRSAGAIV